MMPTAIAVRWLVVWSVAVVVVRAVAVVRAVVSVRLFLWLEVVERLLVAGRLEVAWRFITRRRQLVASRAPPVNRWPLGPDRPTRRGWRVRPAVGLVVLG